MLFCREGITVSNKIIPFGPVDEKLGGDWVGLDAWDDAET